MSYWEGRATLVTGGAGFGGAHLCQELVRRGARVHVLDKYLPRDSYLHFAALTDSIHFIQGDICDAAALRLLLARQAFDVVFHVAAQPIVAMANALPAETATVNIDGTYNVLEACRACKAPPRLVFASSGAYYGATRAAEPIPEDAPPLAAANIYAPTKVAGDIAVRCYARTYGLAAATCRFMNTYGPGDSNFTRIVPATLARFMRGERALINGSDGTNVLELLHVRDMAEGYLAVAENLDKDDVIGEAFNFGSGTPLSLHQVALQLARAWNTLTYPHEQVIEEPVISGPHIESIKYLDIRKAGQRLGWSRRTPLDQGLQSTARWYREHRNFYE